MPNLPPFWSQVGSQNQKKIAKMHVQDASIFCINFDIDFCSIWAPSWCHLRPCWPLVVYKTHPRPTKRAKKTVLVSKTTLRSIFDWFLVDVWSIFDRSRSAALAVRPIQSYKNEFPIEKHRFLMPRWPPYDRCFVIGHHMDNQFGYGTYLELKGWGRTFDCLITSVSLPGCSLMAGQSSWCLAIGLWPLGLDL